MAHENNKDCGSLSVDLRRERGILECAYGSGYGGHSPSEHPVETKCNRRVCLIIKQKNTIIIVYLQSLAVCEFCC